MAQRPTAQILIVTQFKIQIQGSSIQDPEIFKEIIGGNF